MQRLFILVFFVLLNLKNSSAQSINEGIYLSAKDFITGKISYSKIPGKKYKLYLHELVSTSTIKVTNGDSTFIFKKDSIFGYRDKANNVYRFYNNTKYLILNPKETLLLYGTNSLGGPKNTQTVTNYFFSADANSPIYKLSKSNIKSAFENKKVFIELLDIWFISDKTLIEFDTYSKEYKLNKIEKLSSHIKINTQEK